MQQPVFFHLAVVLNDDPAQCYCCLMDPTVPSVACAGFLPCTQFLFTGREHTAGYRCLHLLGKIKGGNMGSCAVFKVAFISLEDVFPWCQSLGSRGNNIPSCFSVACSPQLPSNGTRIIVLFAKKDLQRNHSSILRVFFTLQNSVFKRVTRPVSAGVMKKRGSVLNVNQNIDTVDKNEEKLVTLCWFPRVTEFGCSDTMELHRTTSKEPFLVKWERI